jgi:glycerol-3-phosphate dehydrogenase
MGPCQGAFCTPRAAALLDQRHPGSATKAMRGFLDERFRGTRPIAWGDQLAELWLAAGIYRGTLAVDGLDAGSNEHEVARAAG